MCPQFEAGPLFVELLRLVGDVLDIPSETLPGSARLADDLDPESLMDVLVAIEQRCQVRFAEQQLLELTSAANIIEHCIQTLGITPQRLTHG
jgi:hypothetical protein